MSVFVDSTEYRLAHGKEPRGMGGWMFFFDREQDVMKAWSAPANSSYGEAKKAAVAEAKRRGARIVRVGS